MFSKFDEQTFTSQFKFPLVPHSYSLLPHQSQNLSKLLNKETMSTKSRLMFSKLDQQTFPNEFKFPLVLLSYGHI